MDDADDQSEVDLSDCEDDAGSDQGVEEEPPESPEASPENYIFNDYLAPSQGCEDTQPSSPLPINDVIEIPDTPAKTMEHGNQASDGSDGGEDVKNTHVRNRADLEDKINALTFKLNNAKKMYASKFFGFNSVYLLPNVQNYARWFCS